MLQKDDAYEVERVAAWVRLNDFERIAVQFPDELLSDAPRMVSQLQRKLPGRKIFVLGDSTYGSSSVDEVVAEHYCADCIVHIGPSDQQRAGSTPVLFVFGQESLDEAALLHSTESLVGELLEHFDDKETCSLLLIIEVALHHALSRILPALLSALGRRVELFLASPRLEARGIGSLQEDDELSLWAWRDSRFGVAPIGSAWWASLGPLARAAASSAEPLKVCGRMVHRVRPGSLEDIGARLTRLPARCGFVYVGTAGSALERRAMLRYCYAGPCWRLAPCGGPPVRLSSDALLLQRYRFVELAKSAATVGLMLTTSAAPLTKAVADRLETLLRRAGRHSYRFVIGRLTPEKLGNFPEVEIYVSLASPEHFPFNTRDFYVPIASPFELEVALGAREWTGDYITDLEELLASPLPVAPVDDSALSVQTLGAGGRMRHFDAGGSATSAISGLLTEGHFIHGSTKGPAAVLSEGLHGVASKYISEPTNAPGGQTSR